jgi:hypothetical protein
MVSPRELCWRVLVVLYCLSAFALAGAFACRAISLEDAVDARKGDRW